MLALLVSLAVFNRIIYRSSLNPIFLQSLVWLVYYVCLSLNIDAYDVYLQDVQSYILYQSLGFSAGGLICCLFTKTKTLTQRQQVNTVELERSYANIAFLYPFVMVIILMAIIYLIKQVGSLSLFSIMDFRETLSEDDGKKVGAIGTLQLLTSVYVVLYIGTLSVNKQAWYKGAVLVLAFLYFTLLLGSKGQFVSFFCASIYLLIWQNKINRLYLGVSVLSFVAIILFLFFLRAGGEKAAISDDSLSDLFLIYTVTALPALHLIESPVSKVFGFYTFRIFYVWLNKFGFNYPVAPVLSEWVVTPLPTNVYSYLMPYYKDFGYTGLFMVPFILGIMHNLVYFKSNKGSLTFLVLNALLIYPIITQIWEENYFRQITNWMYIAIIVLLLTKLNFGKKPSNITPELA